MSILGVTVDGEADAAYATLSTRPVARTFDLGCGLIVDLAADGTLVGIEVLGYSKPFDLGPMVGATFINELGRPTGEPRRPAAWRREFD